MPGSATGAAVISDEPDLDGADASGDIVTDPVTDLAAVRIRRRKVLGGLIHEYERVA